MQAKKTSAFALPTQFYNSNYNYRCPAVAYTSSTIVGALQLSSAGSIFWITGGLIAGCQVYIDGLTGQQSG